MFQIIIILYFATIGKTTSPFLFRSGKAQKCGFDCLEKGHVWCPDKEDHKLGTCFSAEFFSKIVVKTNEFGPL